LRVIGPQHLRDQQAVHVFRHEVAVAVDLGDRVRERLAAVLAGAEEVHRLPGEGVAHPAIVLAMLREMAFGQHEDVASELVQDREFSRIMDRDALVGEFLMLRPLRQHGVDDRIQRRVCGKPGGRGRAVHC
jgi:hypothetical protein